MKIIGVLLICFALAIAFVCDKYPTPNEPEPIIGLTFCIFILGMYCLILDDSTESVGFEKYNHPAPPKKCICNDIGKHTSGGRCEADHSAVKCQKDCGNTKPYPRGKGSICLNCGSSIIKDEELELLRPKFPKDRTE